MQADDSKNWFQKLNERIDSEPRPSAEEMERIRAEREALHEAMEGTSKEIAFMSDDYAVSLKFWTYKDGVIGDGWDLVKPTDPHYQEVCSRHGLEKPGDAHTIRMKWIDGQWVETPEE